MRGSLWLNDLHFSLWIMACILRLQVDWCRSHCLMSYHVTRNFCLPAWMRASTHFPATCAVLDIVQIEVCFKLLLIVYFIINSILVTCSCLSPHNSILHYNRLALFKTLNLNAYLSFPDHIACRILGLYGCRIRWLAIFFLFFFNLVKIVFVVAFNERVHLGTI